MRDDLSIAISERGTGHGGSWVEQREADFREQTFLDDRRLEEERAARTIAVGGKALSTSTKTHSVSHERMPRRLHLSIDVAGGQGGRERRRWWPGGRKARWGGGEVGWRRKAVGYSVVATCMTPWPACLVCLVWSDGAQ